MEWAKFLIGFLRKKYLKLKQNDFIMQVRAAVDSYRVILHRKFSFAFKTILYHNIVAMLY